MQQTSICWSSGLTQGWKNYITNITERTGIINHFDTYLSTLHTSIIKN